MKTFGLDKMGVNELSFIEMKELNGGGWGALIRVIIAAIAGGAAGAAGSQCSDDCTTTTCVDENGCTIATTVCN